MRTLLIFLALCFACATATTLPCLFTKKLTPATITGDAQNVNTDAKVSPNKAAIAYLLRAGTNDELWVNNVKGGISVKLNGMLTATGDVHEGFMWTPSSSHVIFQAETDAAGGNGNLFSNARAGGTPVLLNPALDTNKQVDAFMVTADSARVVYWGDVNTDGKRELYSVAVAGPAPGTLVSNATNPDVQAGVRLTTPAMAANQKIVWAENDPSNTFTSNKILYSANADGTGRVTLRPAMSGRSISTWQLAGVDKSTHALFIGPFSSNNTQSNLYSVALTGGTIAQLNADFTGTSNIDRVSNFWVSPDGTKVVFQVYLFSPTPTQSEFYLVDAAGTNRQKINLGAITTLRSDLSPQVTWSADGAHVLIRGDFETSGADELWSFVVATPATAAVKLNPVMASADVENYVISPNSMMVAVNGDFTTDGKDELYVVGIAGTPAWRKVSTRTDSDDVGDNAYRWTGDSARLAFWWTSQPGEVWSVAGASGAAVKVSPDGGATNADLRNGVQITADNAYIVWEADHETAGRYRLWSGPIAGPAVSLTATKYATGTDLSTADLRSWGVAPSGNKIVYTCDCDENADPYIYSIGASLAGVTVRLNVNQGTRTGADIESDFIVTGTENNGGDWVIYRGDFETSNEDLTSAAIACAVSTTSGDSAASSVTYSVVLLFSVMVAALF